MSVEEVTPTKHAGGRPTKLTPELMIIARDYVNECTDTIEHFEGESGKQWETVRVKLPTMEGLARKLKIRRETVWDWSHKNDEFSNIIDDLMAEQADRLINQGLAGNYNSTISKVLLSGKHGYVERNDVTTGGEKLPSAIATLDPTIATAFKSALGDGTKA